MYKIHTLPMSFILWYSLESLSSTTMDRESERVSSPLKMKLRLPRVHCMPEKSPSVESSLGRSNENRKRGGGREKVENG